MHKKKQNINQELFDFNIENFSSQALENAFKNFLNQPLEYRTQFLQEKYQNGF